MYKGSAGHLPNEGTGTNDGHQITAPPKGTGQSHWNAVSNFALRGSRPVVQTLRGQDAKDQGDYVFIRYKKPIPKLIAAAHAEPARYRHA